MSPGVAYLTLGPGIDPAAPANCASIRRCRSWPRQSGPFITFGWRLRLASDPKPRQRQLDDNPVLLDSGCKPECCGSLILPNVLALTWKGKRMATLVARVSIRDHCRPKKTMSRWSREKLPQSGTVSAGKRWKSRVAVGRFSPGHRFATRIHSIG